MNSNSRCAVESIATLRKPKIEAGSQRREKKLKKFSAWIVACKGCEVTRPEWQSGLKSDLAKIAIDGAVFFCIRLLGEAGCWVGGRCNMVPEHTIGGIGQSVFGFPFDANVERQMLKILWKNRRC